MKKSALDAIREAEQELNNIDWSIEVPAENNYAARVGKALGLVQIALFEMEFDLESNARKIAALKAIQERI